MNRQHQFRRLIGLFTLLAGFGEPKAQRFRYTADLDPVPVSGFYAIPVTPPLSSGVKTDFSDLRIKDDKGKPVPYLLESALPELYEERYQAMRIRTNAVDDSGNNVIIVDNSPGVRLDGFRLLFQNAAVSRTIDLAGSNDTARWFSIVENIGLQRRFVQDSDSFSEQLSFPLSSCRYFRVFIRNGRNKPLKVLSADRLLGNFKLAPLVSISNPPPEFNSKDSAGITTLTLRNPMHYHISAVTIQVSSPRFFQRSLTCYAGGRQAGDFVIKSDSVLHLALPLLNDSLITIQIYNEDNPALEISSVSTQQYAEKIITYLEKSRSYKLEMSSDVATTPHYDLIHFKDSIPANVPSLHFSRIIPLESNPVAAKKDDQNGWLWPCLVFVIIVLGLSAYRLAKDVAEKKSE